MAKKKRRLKRKVKLVGFIFVLIVVCLLVIEFRPKYKKDRVIEKEVDVISNILSKLDDKDIDKDFLTWIGNNYGNKVLVKLDKNIDSYNRDIWHDLTGNSYIVLNDLYNKRYDSMNNIKNIEKSGDIFISFVGDVSLADNWYIMPKYDERGKKVYGILSEETVDIMTKSDIMVANSEFTISDRGEKMQGKYYTFRGSPKRIPIYNEMGVDLLTLANNHVYDFGEIAFNDMIDSLNEYKMPYIGAGKNIDEAKKAFYFVINGYKISFVNATRAEKLILTPEAKNSSGGVFRCYDPTEFINVIKEERNVSDYVIALIHWGREDSHDLEDVQVETSKMYIDAGADMIVGSHAHVLQGIEFYNDKPIIYNLGDFIFNNETKDTGIFKVNLKNNGSMDYYFIPAIESGEYTKVVDGEEKLRIIKNMNSWSVNASIDSDGKITKK